MITFKTSLSPTAIENLIKEFNVYSLKFESAKTDILEALTEYTYERIMFYMPIPRTGQLMNSFVREISGNIGKVYTDLYYAKFVEFGTGIRGSNSEYDSKYVHGLKYSSEYAGQAAQKFIYQAVLDVERDYKEIVRNVLKQKGLL